MVGNVSLKGAILYDSDFETFLKRPSNGGEISGCQGTRKGVGADRKGQLYKGNRRSPVKKKQVCILAQTDSHSCDMTAQTTPGHTYVRKGKP